MRTLLLTLMFSATTSAAELDVWVGTNQPNNGQPAGIYYLTLDDQTGELSRAHCAAEQDGAGFLELHPLLNVLYSTGDGVSSWQIIVKEGKRQLEKINSQSTGDGGAAHIAVDRTWRVLLSAQYGGGSVASFKLAKDGSIGERVSLIEHEGHSGVDPGRQESCHPHWVGVSPDNQYVIVPDLGADKVFIHKLDAKTGKLTRHGAAAAVPGGGPRHFKFDPSGQFGYLLNELTVSLSVYRWNASAGELALIQTIPALTEQQKAGQDHNSGSEVRVHPSGKFVYSANRGHDSISAFKVDRSSGKLSLVEVEPIRGSWPRNFNLDPSGRWLLAAGRDSNTLSVFSIDQETGALRYALKSASVPAPICVVVAKPVPSP